MVALSGRLPGSGRAWTALSAAEAQIEAVETWARELHATKSFLQRILSSPAEAKAACKWRNEAAAQREGLLRLSDQLESAMDKKRCGRFEPRLDADQAR
jgi:hypothetical protein